MNFTVKLKLLSGRIHNPINRPSQKQVVSFLFFGFILFFAYLKEAKLGEDWESYYLNLEADVLLIDTVKQYWYRYFLFPLRIWLGSSDSALMAVKLITVSTFFVVYQRSAKTLSDFLVLFVVLIFVPSMSDNYMELLRQGTALSIALVATTLSGNLLRYAVYLIAVLFHAVSTFPIALIIFSGAIFKANGPTGKCERVKFLATCLLIALILSLVSCTLLISGFSSDFLDLDIMFFQGDRSNLYAVIFLVLYATYLIFQSLASRQVLHCVSFFMVGAVLAFYPVTTDFGRMITLISPFHFAAAFLIDRNFQRKIDALAAVAFGSALALI